MARATLEDWVDDRQSAGKYTFARKEAIAESGLSDEAVKKALQRLVTRQRIAKAKDYFFVIVPLEYSSAGSPPAQWFVHDLMTAMGRRYYVGLLSAAALHGASHHQPQEFQVVTDRPIRPIAVGRNRMRFFTSKFVEAAAVTRVKTPTGIMQVSTPETTVVDLVRFARVTGHLDHVATVISELSANLDSKRLVAAVKVGGDVPNSQRLGFILDRIRARELADHLKRWVDRQGPNPVPLRSHRRGVDAKEDRRWRVLIDRPLELEA